MRRGWIAGTAVVLALTAGGSYLLAEPSREAYPIRGVDVSHHQGEIDWRRVAGSGARFAYIKASEGRDLADRRFAANWGGARAAGLARGAYHFFTFCSPGPAQAEHFLEVVPPDPSVLRPVVDVEFVGNCKSWGDLERVRTDLGAFLERVEVAWGRRPILYVTPDSFERVLAGRFPGHAIWIRSVLLEPAGDAYGGWLIWQYTDRARVPGIAGRVDRNTLRPGASLRDLE